MAFLDILFPFNIGPLTYRCPEILSGRIRPGMIVSAELKKKIAKGIVIEESPQIPVGAVKDILEVHGDAPILSEKMIALMKWMSDYYLAEPGLVLKNILPKEALTKVKQRKTDTKQTGEHLLSLVAVDDMMAAGLISEIKGFAYGTFLLHSPSSVYEYSFLTRVLAEIRNGIILVPEVAMIGGLYPILRERFGERLSLFHSDLSRGKRSEMIGRILSGRSDIVIGTRSAVFAPLKKVSFIAVLHEHSGSYKQENSPCYGARDVAVMRGYLEKATVLLSSICPSVESLFNCETGKYHLLKPSYKMRRPRIRLIDMKHEKLVKPYLSRIVVDAASKYIKDDKNIMFVINRRGYSTSLQCGDCSRIEECPRCKIPLVFHKQDMSMKCHYCGYVLSKVPDRCSGCQGFNLKLSGAGTQKIQEEVEELTGIRTLRIDSDKAGDRAGLEELTGSTSMQDQRIIVGTKFMTGRLIAAGRFSMAALLNTDLFLNIPDFRSAEKAYQEILSVTDKIDPDGEVFVQTRMPQNYLFKCLKKYDYDSFFKEELNRRKALAYPPYSRLLLIKFISMRDISPALSETVHNTMMPPHNSIIGEREGPDNGKIFWPSRS